MSNTTLSVLAEAESLASYGRKRLALSYEKPTTSQRVKSHSPNEGNRITSKLWAEKISTVLRKAYHFTEGEVSLTK